MWNLLKKTLLPAEEQALPGRSQPILGHHLHAVHGQPIQPPFPAHLQQAIFGMGCFWGAERKFWQQAGVFTTAVGYAGGFTPNPFYEEVCSGLTGHAEVVLVIFDPALISYQQLLKLFWESHDPTQGMRQGNDIGTQYRSVIYCHDQWQVEQTVSSREQFQQLLNQHDYSTITTEIRLAPTFYYAESEHQQYLAKNPAGYCGLGGLGICLDKIN